MADEDKPLSQMVSQGWEILEYTVAAEADGFMQCFLLRRQKQHKILRLRPKTFGKGYVVRELDV
ncbi:MAG: hypothetical protein JF615_11520 [Asticcacaulis sp.]|nr:hypothetical protein [Asticcacaulis sp.]